jgi:hypothetical protein
MNENKNNGVKTHLVECENKEYIMEKENVTERNRNWRKRKEK